MTESVITIRGYDECPDCGLHLHEHDKERVYNDDGPVESYHYEYQCPGGEA
jgi:hypothetical protein